MQVKGSGKVWNKEGTAQTGTYSTENDGLSISLTYTNGSATGGDYSTAQEAYIVDRAPFDLGEVILAVTCLLHDLHGQCVQWAYSIWQTKDAGVPLLFPELIEEGRLQRVF